MKFVFYLITSLCISTIRICLILIISDVHKDLSHLHYKNKRPMSHMVYPRNQFKSMNTFEQSYDYINILYKRSMGHIAYLWKQFKSIKTYNHIKMLITRRKKILFTLWQFTGSSFEQTWIPIIQGCFVPSLVEISPAVLEKKIFERASTTNGEIGPVPCQNCET